MASPSTLPQQPVMPPPRRSFAGPIVLITIGVIFLLGNMGMLGWGRILEWFARFWPLLLILWGSIKLLEYWQAQRGGYRARGIGAGGVFLVILIVLLGSAATGLWRFGPQIHDEIGFQWGDEDTFIPFFGQKYTFKTTLAQALPAGGSVQVTNERGNIRVSVSPDDQIRLMVNAIVVADSEDKAKRVSEARTPKITVQGSVVSIDATGTGGVENAHRARVHFDIQVPRKAMLDLKTLRGDISVSGREGDVKADTSNGDVSLDGITGSADVKLRHGDVTVRKVTGNVSVEGRVSDSNTSDVGGSVDLRGDFFGNISVNRVAGKVRFKSSRTDMELGKLDGDMIMESGDLRVTSVNGVTIRTRSKDIHLENASGPVLIEDSNGEINVDITQLPLAAVNIDNRKGRIELTLPAKAAFSLDASTRNGDIRSDFSEIRVDNQRSDATASGSVGGGAAAVRLRTENADIEIRKGS